MILSFSIEVVFIKRTHLTSRYTIIRRGSTTEATESEDSTSKNTRRTTVSEDQGPTTEKYK